MSSRLVRIPILLALLVVGVLLVADIAYLFRGSLEEFPTPEQESKVRVVTSAIAILLIGVEVALWYAFRRLGSVPQGMHPASNNSTRVG